MTYMVPLTTIKEIKPHPNADRLELAVVYGFEVVVGKSSYKAGDRVIYVPIDSVIPQNLEDALFPPDSKIKLTKHKVRQIRIRKQPSQGMLINPMMIDDVYGFMPDGLETDYSEKLTITKYEPPVRGASFGLPGAKAVKKRKNENFHKYGGLNNFKWYPDKFKEGEMVVFQEKIHGTNARAGILPYSANSLWKRIKKFFRLTPEFEFCYGSNGVQLQDRRNFKGFYGEDVYGKVFKDIEVESRLQPGEQVFGEIYGSGIQKNYDYGCKEGEHRFVLFDVKVMYDNGKFAWLGPDAVKRYAKDRGFHMVPELYRGPFDPVKAREATLGNSVMAPMQKVREGIVIKALDGYDEGMHGKRALKLISEKYLDKEQTDFH